MMRRRSRISSTFYKVLSRCLLRLAASSLAALATSSGIEATAHAGAIFGKMRDDTPHESLSQAAMLQNAPDQAQGQIRVPKVVTDA